MKPIRQMTMGELAAWVCSHLEKRGIEVVLSGGSCVAIYSSDRYVSWDLDFIDNHFTKRRKIREALAELGFVEEKRYFRHQETPYYIEFPAGPLAAGQEPMREILSMEYPTGTLRIISPTECVKDRLAAYYHWGDLQCLEQAVLVAETQDVDFGEIERWSRSEGKLKEFQKIRKRFRVSGKPG